MSDNEQETAVPVWEEQKKESKTFGVFRSCVTFLRDLWSLNRFCICRFFSYVMSFILYTSQQHKCSNGLCWLNWHLTGTHSVWESFPADFFNAAQINQSPAKNRSVSPLKSTRQVHHSRHPPFVAPNALQDRVPVWLLHRGSFAILGQAQTECSQELQRQEKQGVVQPGPAAETRRDFRETAVREMFRINNKFCSIAGRTKVYLYRRVK